MRTPVCTYRIQLTPSFGFSDAGKILDYLKRLGISDIYSSPVFMARKGSVHGYDVVDPRRVNDEMGGEDAFMELLEQVRSEGMGWIQDIVPNHMAFDKENRMLMDVIEKGELSRYYDLFDIDWDHPYDNLNGRLLAPFLGTFYGEALMEKKGIKLGYREGGLFVKYYDHQFPVSLDSYADVLLGAVPVLETELGKDHHSLSKFIGVIHFFEVISSAPGEKGQEERIDHAKRMLWQLYSGDSHVKTSVDLSIERLNAHAGSDEGVPVLDELLCRQKFRLSFWKVATEEINYRRFFNINGLICLKVEDKEVFDVIHAAAVRFMEKGLWTGLRVDHIDGLAAPEEYLRRLRAASGQDAYIVVEKILEGSERLPDEWPVQGTTGYDFLNMLNGVFCDTSNDKEFIKLYHRLTGYEGSYNAMVREKKRLIMGKHMAGDIDNLAHMIKKAASNSLYGRDLTLYGLRRALVEIMSCLPVYRTYVSRGKIDPEDRQRILEASAKARAIMPVLRYEIAFMENMLFSGSDGKTVEGAGLEETDEFVKRFQQYTGPLMAKGFEDTVMYVYNKFISFNEVGGDPSRFGVSLREFHEFNAARAANGSRSMNASSTHDTKRGEDMRARLNVLSEIPGEWRDNIMLWRRMNRPRKRMTGGIRVPDDNDEYFLYQTLVGSMPFNISDMPGYVGRIKEYILKSVREAKVHTAWLENDEEYEGAYLEFVEKILNDKKRNSFLESLKRLHAKTSFHGMLNSFSQTVLKLTSPGVPDIYQGSEKWNFSLVDPDNRRPVDFETFARDLDMMVKEYGVSAEDTIAGLMEKFEDGRIKTFLIWRVLALRGRREHLFSKGEYLPLGTSGDKADNVIAFARVSGDEWAVVVAPRFTTRLVKYGNMPLGGGVWTDTRVILPANAPREFIDAITGNKVYSDGFLQVGKVLSLFPSAVLEGRTR